MTHDAAQTVKQLGIVLETADPERAWNAFRLGITALDEGQEVSVFLLGEGVEAEEITDDQFDVRDRMEAFVDVGGDLQACGTCLDMRNSEESEYCPMSTMADLLEIVTSSDRVLTIG
ncbi:DsrE family protein [Salinadaptatus halalkaliphilus]|uniref:DsrE family protein n=1 Tax=Salinadaptatus halalkaliphilus TaxID=2419781 RepID=A0A4S3TH45_9EURY|nr:DsrE family protein [Salinadaptatus halalkaliphilus]THE63221.1 DsrE family protein [Salinadaptatus halalkaliphilus]